MYTDRDVVIIGAGCAGLSAALYTGRAGFDTLVLEKESYGGELVNRQLIENYPGFPNGIQGLDLAGALLEQAENAGAEFESTEALSIQDKGSYKIVRTKDGTITCKGIVIATGSHERLLNIPGESEFTGKGVFYCATCDGPQCAGRPVAVVGGGDSALTDALHLVNLDCDVTVISHSNELRASHIMQERASGHPRVKILTNTDTISVTGHDWVESLEMSSRLTGNRFAIEVSGVYVRIGQVSNTDFVKDILELTPDGHIPVNSDLESTIPGIVVAGNIRFHNPAQMGACVGDGITAAMSLGRYINTIA